MTKNKKEAQRKTPVLRFKGFNDDWEQRQFGDLGTITAGGDKNTSKLQKEGIYPVIANNLGNNGVIGYYNDFYKIKAPAITITARGNIGIATARFNNFTPIVRLLVLETSQDINFMEQAINNINFFIESTGIPQLTVPQLSKYSIFITDKNEQKRIGELFKILSNLLTLYERKVKLLTQIKKYFLDNLFANKEYPNLRFKGFTDAWEQRMFSETNDIRDGTHDTPKYISSGYPLITSKNLTSSNNIDLKNVSYISKEDFDSINKRSKVDIGDILFGMIGTIGNPILLRKKVNFAIKNVALIKKSKITNPYFLLSILNSNIFKRYILRINQGNTQKFISLSQIRNFSYFIPKMDEQNKIGKLFEVLDNLLTLYENKQKQLLKIKNNFLSNMFI